MPGSIFIEFAAGASRGAYRVAGQAVVTRPVLPPLERFRDREDPTPDQIPPVLGFEPGTSSDPRSDSFVRRVSGLVAGRERSVDCWSLPDGSYRLKIDGIGAFRIARGHGDTVIQTGVELSELAVAAALGPALSLALAWSDVWILHGSAVSRDGRVLAFVGPGGVGKSTLADHLANRSEGGWNLLADDQLPVRLGDGGIEVLPRFPQPRWGRDESRVRVSRSLPEILPLAAVYRLGRTDLPDEEPLVAPLPGRRGAAAVIDQTIGASLLDEPLLERHLEFCGRLAETVPVFALDYPLDRVLLPAVEELLDPPEAVRGDGGPETESSRSS